MHLLGQQLRIPHQTFLIASLLFSLIWFKHSALANEREGTAVIRVKVYETPEAGGTRCINIAFLVFDDEEDVTWNKISYYDALKGKTEEQTITPPFDDDYFLSGLPDGEFDAAEGEHQVGLALVSVGEDEFSPGNCANAKEALQDRFSEAAVFFDRKLNKISGSVTQWYCSAHGAEVIESQRRFPEFGRLVDDPNPSCERRGVIERIIARRAGSGRPRQYRTTVNGDGTFELLVKDGTYRVGVRNRRRRKFLPTRPLRVQVDGEDVSDIDFEYRSNKRLKLKVRDGGGDSGHHISPDLRFVRSHFDFCNQSSSDEHDHVVSGGVSAIPPLSRGQCDSVFGPMVLDSPIFVTVTCNLHVDEYGMVFIVPFQDEQR